MAVPGTTVFTISTELLYFHNNLLLVLVTIFTFFQVCAINDEKDTL